MKLRSDEIHVYWARLDGAPLDPRDRRRHASEVGRKLVRAVLSRYADVAPDDWAFAADEHGRPRALGGALGDVDFNLSHSATLAVCAVARGAVGVDVEDLAPPAPLEVAARFFAPSEARALLAEPAERQSRRFYEYWVLKESYLKARGVGLRLPLDRFAFDLADVAAPRVSFVAPIDDDAARWWFALFAPTPNHVAAVARRDSPSPPRLVAREQIW